MQRKMVLTWLKVGVAAGIVIFILLSGVDIRLIAADLRSAPRGELLGCWAAYGALWLLSAYRWKIIARVQGIAVTYSSFLRFCFIGLFFNNIMLGSIGGDLMKAYYLARSSPEKKEGAVISVISDRIIGLLSFFGIGLIGFAVNRANPDLGIARGLFLAFFLAMCAGVVIVSSRSIAARMPFAAGIINRLPFREKILRLHDALLAYRSQGRAVAKALLLSCALQLATITIMYRLAMALGVASVTWTNLLLVIPLLGTIFAIPVTPSGWGTGEYAFYTLFGALGVAAERALALDLMMRAIIISWSLLGGILYALPGAAAFRTERDGSVL